jgi:hypothetical protein
MCEITRNIAAAKSGTNNPPGWNVSCIEESSGKKFEFEDLISFCPMKPRAYIVLEDKDRLPESPGSSMSCGFTDDAELVSTSMFMCNAECNRSFAATAVLEVHMGSWGTSDSNSRCDVEDWRWTLCMGKEGRLSQSSIVPEDEILVERRLDGHGCGAGWCGEDVRIGILRGNECAG